MALVKTYVDTVAVTRKQDEDRVVQAAMQEAARLSAQYGIESYKFNDKMGLMFLAEVRVTRRKGQRVVDTTYLSEARIVNDYHNGISR